MHTSDPWRSSRFKSRLKDSDRLQSEQFAQPLGLGAAHGDFGLFLVIHAKLVGALKPGNDFLDAIDIYQKGTMRAPEKIVIEAVEQFFQGAAVRLSFHAFHAPGNDADNAVVDRCEAYISLANQKQPPPSFQEDLGGLRFL